MRIAICFYGLVGSKIGKNGVGEILDPRIAYNHYKKHIFDSDFCIFDGARISFTKSNI